MNTLTNHIRFIRSFRFLAILLCLCICTVGVMAASADVAYCTSATTPADPGDAIQGAVTMGAQEIYKVMRAIVIPIVILFFGYAGLMFLCGGTKGTEAARKICFGCFAAVAFVTCAPLIGQALGTWFQNTGNGGLDQYNPLS